MTIGGHEFSFAAAGLVHGILVRILAIDPCLVDRSVSHGLTRHREEPILRAKARRPIIPRSIAIDR